MNVKSNSASAPTKAAGRTVQEIIVVVADRSRARVFRIAENSDELLELLDLLNSDARTTENSLVSDRQGRAIYGGLFGKRGRRTTFGKSGSKRFWSAEHFASRICDALMEYINSGKSTVRQIYIIANPEFMGSLRPLLRKLAARAPVREIMKNITKETLPIIRGYLPDRLWSRRVSGITLD